MKTVHRNKNYCFFQNVSHFGNLPKGREGKARGGLSESGRQLPGPQLSPREIDHKAVCAIQLQNSRMLVPAVMCWVDNCSLFSGRTKPLDLACVALSPVIA